MKWTDKNKQFYGNLYDNGDFTVRSRDTSGGVAGDGIYTHTLGSQVTLPITVTVVDTAGHKVETTVEP